MLSEYGTIMIGQINTFTLMMQTMDSEEKVIFIWILFNMNFNLLCDKSGLKTELRKDNIQLQAAVWVV